MIFLKRKQRKEIIKILKKLLHLLQSYKSTINIYLIDIKQTIRRVKILIFRFEFYDPTALFSLTILMLPSNELQDLAINLDWLKEYNQFSSQLEQIFM